MKIVLVLILAAACGGTDLSDAADDADLAAPRECTGTGTFSTTGSSETVDVHVTPRDLDATVQIAVGPNLPRGWAVKPKTLNGSTEYKYGKDFDLVVKRVTAHLTMDYPSGNELRATLRCK